MMIEESNRYLGFLYEVVALPAGYRCGYVKIPKGHPLHGLGYGDTVPRIKLADIADEEVGDRGIIPLLCYDPDAGTVPLDVLFDVHGGITFGDVRRRGIEVMGRVIASWGRGWWIGFDCAHDGDGQDLEIMGDAARELASRYGWLTEGRVWTTEDVASECRRLIDQIRRWYP